MAEKRRKLRPGLMLAMEFLIIILTGTLLLALPVSHKEGVDLSLIDAFFVSTSAVCVTGLTPVVISQTLSLFGSTVLMMLVQLGGVGYAIVAVFLIMMTSGKMHMMTSNLIKDSFGADNRTSIRSLIAVVFGCTAFFELAGAALLMIPFSEGLQSLKRSILPCSTPSPHSIMRVSIFSQQASWDGMTILS